MTPRARIRRVKYRVRQFIKNNLATVNRHPVLVMGNQKSGTTAISALLACHIGQTATLDLRRCPPLLVYPSCSPEELVKEIVRLHRVEFANGVIKDPEFAFLYPQLMARFPQAKFVMVVRDPRDNIRSILNRLNIPGDRREIDVMQYEEVNEEWGKALESTYLEIDHDHYIDRLATRWNRAVDMYLRYESNIHLMRYEDFCADKTGAIADLAQRLCIPQINDITDQVNRQYQSRGDREVSWRDFFGAKNLARIEEKCCSRMQGMGYGLSETAPM